MVWKMISFSRSVFSGFMLIFWGAGLYDMNPLEKDSCYSSSDNHGSLDGTCIPSRILIIVGARV